MSSPEQYARDRIAKSRGQIRHSLEMIADGNPFAAEPDATRRRDRVQAKAQFTPAEAQVFDADVRRRSIEMENAKDSLNIEVEATAAARSVRGAASGQEAVWGDTIDFVDVAFLARGARIARSVGRVAFATNGRGQGSGVLIGAGLFLTNNHVIFDPNHARQFILEFDYERDERGARRAETRYALDPSVFVHDTVDGLDFSIVAIGKRMSGSAELADLGVSPISDASDKHMLGEFANIVQHPQGRLKEVVLRENRLVSRFDDFLHYIADTEKGSSGSPVYNSEWQMIALHHWGEPHGEPGDPLVPGSIEVNEGIRVSSIVRHLKENMSSYPSTVQARLDKALTSGEAAAGGPVHTNNDLSDDPNQLLHGTTQRINAEAAVIAAQAGLAKAKAELAKTNNPPNAAAAADAADLDRLRRLKEKQEARRELAESKMATDLAEAKALIGTVGKSGIEGNVVIKGDAGKGEATLLASRALADAAEQIAAEIKAKLAIEQKEGDTKVDDQRTIVLVPNGEYLQFGNYRQFLLEIEFIDQQFDATMEHAETVLSQRGTIAESAGSEAAAPLMTLAGVAVEAVANLGSFFQTDYEIGGLDIKTDVEQLIGALGGRLLGNGITVTVPLGPVPQRSAFAKLLGKLPKRIADAEVRVAELNGLAQATGKLAESELVMQAAAAVKAVITRAANFIAALGTADANGVLPITKVVQQKAICDALTGESAYLLAVDVRAATGGYYTKKNLWTFFGGLPFYAMGGAIVTYQLLDKKGALYASGLVPRHGGYQSVRNVPEIVNTQALP